LPGRDGSAKPRSNGSATGLRRKGQVLAVRVEDLGEKEAVLAANPRAFFTIPHFDGYPAVLVQLKTVAKRALVDGWLACAPPDLASLPVSLGWPPPSG
jgi:hypothetical protein